MSPKPWAKYKSNEPISYLSGATGDGSVDFIPDYLMEVSDPDFDLNTAKEWFTLEDTNGDGHVSAKELIEIALKVGMPRSEAENTVAGYYMSADRNGDEQLSWEGERHC